MPTSDELDGIAALVEQPARELNYLIEPGKSYPVWSPDSASSTAQAMLEALKTEKGES